MPSLLDKLSPDNVNVQNRFGRLALLDTDNKFKWVLEYTVYKANDESWFEKRIIALFEPFGDVIIQNFTSKTDTKEFHQLYQKKRVLFHRPKNFRTDARIICHLLLNAARANHPFMFKMYMISDRFQLSYSYNSISPVDLGQFNTLYNTFPYPTGDLAIAARNFTDPTLHKGKNEKMIDIVANELNRIREHYLNLAVV